MNKQAMIRDYWPQFRKKAITLTVVIQLLVTATVGGSLVIGGVEINSLLFWIVIIDIFFTKEAR